MEEFIDSEFSFSIMSSKLNVVIKKIDSNSMLKSTLRFPLLELWKTQCLFSRKKAERIIFFS
jgi:hypothetical protein